LASLRQSVDAVQGTPLLAFTLPQLAPGPVPATVSAVFGAQHGRLVALHVSWLAEGEATPQQREQLTQAASTVTADLVAWQWPLFKVARGHVTSPGVLMVFSGRDDHDRGVEVRLEGVPIELQPKAGVASTTTAPLRMLPAGGPALLRLSFVAARDEVETLAVSATDFLGQQGTNGYRSARFGMDEVQLRKVIAADFAPPPEALRSVENPQENTRALVLQLPKLEPGPGPANVVYVLSAADGRLVHVSLQWTTGPQPSAEERQQMAVAGARLANGLKQHDWSQASTLGGRPLGPNAVLLFAAVDGRGAGLELSLAGVATALPNSPDAPNSSSGPARLRLNYSDNLLRSGAAH
jgi:hypothetical protein